MHTLKPFLITVFVLCYSNLINADATSQERPNVLVVLADDLGFSDLGCYGSEIKTPNLDNLALNGIQFTQFYNTARCWPTRGSLMTGYYAQQIRRDAFLKTDAGGQGNRPPWAPMLPALLKPAGYATLHSGKWHLDGTPRDAGFDRSYQLLDDNRHFAPSRHRLNENDLPAVTPDGSYYSTTSMTDRMLEFLQEHEQNSDKQPFFAYLAFTAPHFPLHAPAEIISQYQTAYMSGWDAVRAERLKKQQSLQLGISSTVAGFEPRIGPPYSFPESIAALGPGEVIHETPWKDLTPAQCTFQANKMAVHAAMVDCIDREVGRIVSWLQEHNQIENTVIFFLSDNGASAEIMIRGDGHDPLAPAGSPQSYLCLGPGWSRNCNTPFRRHKTWVHEGGISTPLIVHWPKGISSHELRRQVGHVNCMVPTVLELAGLQPTPANGDGPANFAGISLVPAITKNDPNNSMRTVWWLHEENKALRHGTYKAVKAADEEWQLYDLSVDRIEANDLANSQPDKLAELVKIWESLTAQFRHDHGS